LSGAAASAESPPNLRVAVRSQAKADLVASVLGPGPGFEGFEVQIQGSVGFQQERQPVTVGGKQIHSILRSCRDNFSAIHP